MPKQRVIHRATQYLDGELLFKTYFVTMGMDRSFDKLVDYCDEHGIVNRVTHKPPNRMSVWVAMWRWAIKPENQKVAYEMYNQYKRDIGEYCSWNEWQGILNDTAQNILRENAYARWQGNVPAAAR